MTEYRGPLFWFDPTPGERVRAWLKAHLWWRPVCWFVPIRWLYACPNTRREAVAAWAHGSHYFQLEVAAGRAR